MGSRPIRSAGRRTSGRWAMTDRSVARTKGQSSEGSGHRSPAPTGVTEATPTGRGIMLTVTLTSLDQDEANSSEDQAAVTSAHTVNDRARSIR